MDTHKYSWKNPLDKVTLLLALLKARGSTPRSSHTASLHVLEEQLKIFLHAPNITASNALDWVLVHLHTSLPYSNDGLRIDNITCCLR